MVTDLDEEHLGGLFLVKWHSLVLPAWAYLLVSQWSWDQYYKTFYGC